MSETDDHEHQFPEVDVDGTLVLHPCLLCGLAACDAIDSAGAEIANLLAEVARLTGALAAEQRDVDRHRSASLYWERACAKAVTNFNAEAVFAIAARLEALTAALTSLRDKMRTVLSPEPKPEVGLLDPSIANFRRNIWRAAYSEGCRAVSKRLDALLVSGETTKDDVLTRVDGSAQPQQLLTAAGNEPKSVAWKIEVFREDDGRYAAEWISGDGNEAGMGNYSATPIGALAELCSTLIQVQEDKSAEVAARIKAVRAFNALTPEQVRALVGSGKTDPAVVTPLPNREGRPRASSEALSPPIVSGDAPSPQPQTAADRSEP